jgi:alpha-L-rhamnosidase
LVHGAGSPVDADVNTIPGYSAFWVMGEADYYRHFADLEYLRSIHDPLVQLLSYMEGALDQRNLFAKPRKSWPYVDWSPDMNENTSEARRATQLEFCKAFSDGAWLLQQQGDNASAERFQAKADALKAAAQKFLLDPGTETFGLRHQTNAMAIFSGVADAAQTKTIWQRVLSHPRQFMISPYYNFYVITAMAQAGHRREALEEIRNYWGGMVKEGATSTWEAYDPSWPKEDFHRSLQSDNGQGYFVSLAHGWASGPAAWLIEQVLGIQPLEPGFSEVSIRPDLVDLEWARGAEPTPRGLIRVDYRKAPKGLEAEIDLPQGLIGKVSMPASAGQTCVMVNGKSLEGSRIENGSRLLVQLTQGGHYKLGPASK